MTQKIIVPMVVAIVAAGGGFWGGMRYQKSRPPVFDRSQFAVGTNRQGSPQARNGFLGGRAVIGEITSVDGKTVTVKTSDGSSKIVVVAGSTKINRTSEGRMEDLQTGEQVMVVGSEGSDGTMTAENVSVGVGFGMRMPELNPTGVAQ